MTGHVERHHKNSYDQLKIAIYAEMGMKTIAAKDLKNRTGDALRAVARGENVIVTVRGKPTALLSPLKADFLASLALRLAEDAWKDIEMALKEGKRQFKSADDAMRQTRRRS
jgi:prevent-host-death family protein